MGTVLWHIELSHYNEKVRWALDFKGVAHERRAPVPGLHGGYAAVLTRGRSRRFPVLDLAGRRIGDSTAIIAALEERHPEPPLYPEDPADRARALELEDFFDEQLAPQLRAFAWFYILQDSSAVVESLMPRAGGRRRGVMHAVAPVMGVAMRRDYGITEASAQQARRDVVAAMDRLEAELGPSGYLVGDGFSVADLTAASLFTPALLPPERQYPPGIVVEPMRELGDELGARPGGAWVTEMFARHRGVSAEVAVSG